MKFLPFLLAAPLFAHDLYIMPQQFTVAPGSTLAIEFHNGDSFPVSEAAPTPARLRNAQIITANSVVPIEDLKQDDKITLGHVPVSAPGELLITVSTVPNFIELEPSKFLDYLKEEGLQTVIRWRAEHQADGKPGRERYTKFAKSLASSGASAGDLYKHAVGFDIEFIPEVDPTAMKAGGLLPVRVYLRGKPAPDLQVEAASSTASGSQTKIVGRTDSDGRIAIPIDAPGKWRLHTLYMEPCPSPTIADWDSFWASLTFEVP